MTEPVSIRMATPADAPAIAALVRSLSRYFLADPERPEAAEEFFRTITTEAVAGYMEGGRFRYHLAEIQGETVGVAGMRDDEHLYHLFVAERFHRRGIGVRLWECARADAVARGNPGRFTLNATLGAVPLYERLGFTPTGPVVETHGIVFRPMELVSHRDTDISHPEF